MDLIMGSFADRNVMNFSEGELDQYEQILEINDPDLYNWISGVEMMPANMINPVFEKLLSHKIA